MDAATFKPVIFLAFANDLANEDTYLRNLGEEQRQLGDALDRAERAGLCELVIRSYATAKEIFDVFQDPEYRNRVAVLHFGGHANGYQLLLESSAGRAAWADAAGLAAFLGQQAGLQLVFLNGCSTQPQAQGLLEANVSAVIATSRAIIDEVAADFAARFYQGLAGGADIGTAYEEAAAAVQTAMGASTRALYRGEDTTDDHWPWDLYLKEGAEVAAQWNLPEAVGDPLFGLPPLPSLDLPESPFRHLHWFAQEHAEVFFGRGHQIRDLYNRVTTQGTAPIILLYGQSGVGKSSLLAAGLIPHLEGSHAIRYVRRDQDKGLLGTANAAVVPAGKELPLAEAWLSLEAHLNQPLVVILDQVEEVYSRRRPDQPGELKDFFGALEATFADPSKRPHGRLILGFRKEWLPEIERQLMDRRLPRAKVLLEHLDRRGIIEAVAGPAHAERLHAHYGLVVEAGLPEVIADTLLEDQESAIAPTLQILLTKLWDKARERGDDPPHFDLELYHTLKREGILLQDFLDQQLDELKGWRADVVDLGLALDVLAFHTTPLGTAELRSSEQLLQTYSHQEEVLPGLVQRCKDLYLLVDPLRHQRGKVTATRLAHDTLAPLVRERFGKSAKLGQRAHRILEDRVLEWQEDQQGAPLDEADLSVVEHGKTGMRDWNATEQRLIEASRKQQARRQRSRRIWQGAGVTAVLAILVASGVALWQRDVAVQAQTEAERQRDVAQQAARVAEEQRNRALIAQSKALSAVSRQQTDKGLVTLGTLLALEALPDGKDRSFVPSAEASLLYALFTQREKHILRGHTGAVSQIRFAPDSTLVVTASEDKTARIWEVNSGKTLAILQDHDGPVNFAEFSNDGRRIVTASDDHTARIWDVETGKMIVLLEGHRGDVYQASFSPDGRQVITASNDGTARVWRLSETGLQGKPLVLGGHTGPVWSAAFSQDGKRVVTASDDRTARVWRLSERGLEEGPLVLGGHTERVFHAAFSPDGTRIITASWDRTARLWNGATGKRTAILKGHEDGVEYAAFSPDGKMVVTTSADGTARLWDGITGRPIAVLQGHKVQVYDARFSPDGRWLVTAADDQTARLWDVATRETIAVLPGHFKPVWSASFSPDGRLVATASDDNTARIWIATSNKTVAALKGHEGYVYQTVFSWNGAQLVTVSQDRTARIWDADTGSGVAVLEGHEGEVWHAAFSPDGQRVVTASTDGTARLWDANTGSPITTLIGHKGWVGHAHFSPEGRTVVTASEDKTARIWEVNSGKTLAVLQGHDGPVNFAEFSNDGHRIVTASDDHTARIWDATSGKLITTLTGHQARVVYAAFSPDNSRLVTASRDETARLWDAASGESLAVLRGHKDPVWSAVFSPDGRRVVTASWDNTARVWDATDGKPLFVLRGHGGRVVDSSFSSDGRLVITAAWDGTVRLWHAESGQLVSTLKGHRHYVVGAAFAPGGRHVATASWDHTARLWKLPVGTGDDWIRYARDNVPRELTDDERRRYLEE